MFRCVVVFGQGAAPRYDLFEVDPNGLLVDLQVPLTPTTTGTMRQLRIRGVAVLAMAAPPARMTGEREEGEGREEDEEEDDGDEEDREEDDEDEGKEAEGDEEGQSEEDEERADAAARRSAPVRAAIIAALLLASTAASAPAQTPLHQLEFWNNRVQAIKKLRDAAPVDLVNRIGEEVAIAATSRPSCSSPTRRTCRATALHRGRAHRQAARQPGRDAGFDESRVTRRRSGHLRLRR